MREASYTQSFRCLMKRAPQYKYIGCNPFSGRLTHSTRQMREHKTVSPNYRRLSTSTIVFVRRKDFQEEWCSSWTMFVIAMSNLVELFGCAFAFWERRRRNDFLDRRLDVCCYRRLWLWCCLLLLLKQVWSCNCDFCWRRSVMSFDKVIKQWFRIVVCVCSISSAQCLMEAEHSCSIVAVSIPFLLLKLERLGFLFMTFPIFIFCYARC